MGSNGHRRNHNRGDGRNEFCRRNRGSICDTTCSSTCLKRFVPRDQTVKSRRLFSNVGLQRRGVVQSCAFKPAFDLGREGPKCTCEQCILRK